MLWKCFFAATFTIILSVALADCGGVGPSVQQISTSLQSADSATQLSNARRPKQLYILSGSCNCILIYPLKGKKLRPNGSIHDTPLTTGQPQSINFDGKGNLYAVLFGSSSILEYAPGAKNASKVLNDPGESPARATVDKAGTVYVANFTSTTGGPGGVSIYSGGSVNPTQTITAKAIMNMVGVAVDEHGDIFVDGWTSSNTGLVGEFKPNGQGGYVFSKLAVPSRVQSLAPEDLALDRSGNLILSSQGNVSIAIFSPPNWKLVSRLGSSVGVTGLALTSNNKSLFASFVNNYSVLQYSYPDGKQINQIILLNNSSPLSVAVSP